MNAQNTHAPSRRWGARVAAVTGTAVVGVVAMSGIALACHAIPNPDITKTSYSCSGSLNYEVDSWSQDTTNANASDAKIRVEVAINGGAFTTVAESPIGPGKPIIGVWTSPTAITSAIVQATPEVPWNGGDTTEQPVSTPVSLTNGPCVAVPAATVTPVSCTTGSAGVVLTNTGTRPATITVAGTNPVSSVVSTVSAAATTTVAVPVTEGATSTVTATTPGTAAGTVTTLATQALTRTCTVSKPTATVTASCAGMVALLDNTASNVLVTFTVSGPAGKTDYVVAAGKTLTTPAVLVADGATAITTVTASGSTLASMSYTAACAAPVTPVVPVVPVTPVVSRHTRWFRLHAGGSGCRRFSRLPR